MTHFNFQLDNYEEVKIEEPKFDINSFFAKMKTGSESNQTGNGIPEQTGNGGGLNGIESGGATGSGVTTGSNKDRKLTAAEVEQMSVEQIEEKVDLIAPICPEAIREKNIEELQNQLNLIMKIEKKVEAEMSKSNVESESHPNPNPEPKRNSSRKFIDFCAICAIAFAIGKSLAINRTDK